MHHIPICVHVCVHEVCVHMHVRVCVCACVCVCSNNQRLFEYTCTGMLVYESNLDEFDIIHCQIRCHHQCLHLPPYKLSGPITLK